MKKLRLLITEACNRSCKGCCNKDWDLSKLEVETDFKQYDEIMLTGGEPMLNPRQVFDFVDYLHKNSHARIYMYTAKLDDIPSLLGLITVLSGITVTLHEQSDVDDFNRLDEFISWWLIPKQKSFRLNVFKGVELTYPSVKHALEYVKIGWTVKTDIEWIENCPLPVDEVFKRWDMHTWLRK